MVLQQFHDLPYYYNATTSYDFYESRWPIKSLIISQITKN